MSTNSNNSALITEDLAVEVVQNVAAFKKADKQVQFFLYYLFDLPIHICAKLAGYTENYGYKLIQKYRKQPNLRERVNQIAGFMPDHYRTMCKLRLPMVAEIEGKALQEYSSDARLAIDKPQLLRQVKAGAGLMVDEGESQPTTPIHVCLQVQAVLAAQITASEQADTQTNVLNSDSDSKLSQTLQMMDVDEEETDKK